MRFGGWRRGVDARLFQQGDPSATGRQFQAQPQQRLNAIASEGRRNAVIRKHEVENRFAVFRKNFDVADAWKDLGNNANCRFSTPSLHSLRVRLVKWLLKLGRVTLNEVDLLQVFHGGKRKIHLNRVLFGFHIRELSTSQVGYTPRNRYTVRNREGEQRLLLL